MPSNLRIVGNKHLYGEKMIIKSTEGKILIQADHKTVRGALEYCAERGIILEKADLRRAKLTHANLDGLQAPGASFWGADFTASDVGFANLQNADLRNATFKDTCFAQTDFTGADLRGAYFSRTLVEGACLDRIVVSCPTFWDCDLRSADSLKGARFTHKGEHTVLLCSSPLVIHGLKRRMVLMEDLCFWGNNLYPAGLLPREGQKQLFLLKTTIDRMMRGSHSPIANRTIPKINGLLNLP